MVAAHRLIPTLTDGPVTLRAPREEDVDATVEQCRDPLTQQWTHVPVPYGREDARTYLRHVIPGGWETDREWSFVVEAPDDDGTRRFAGTISLRNERDGRAEIAYGAHPWVRGRGVMERALRLLLEWGFAERDLRTVLWRARRGNWRSRRLAWRLGFAFEATLRDWMPQRGDLSDEWLGTLRREDPRSPAHEWLVAPRVVGESVVLRATREDDLPRIVEAVNDAEVQRWSQSIREHAPHDVDTVRQRELVLGEESARGTSLTWSVADPGTDRFLGQVAVFGIHPGREAEIGYWAHPDARGRGVMTRACRMAVRHAFVDREDGGLGLHRLTAYAGEGNVASQRILLGAGFTRFGIERRSTLLPDGSFVDTHAFDRLATDP